MYETSKEYALEKAIELAKANIERSQNLNFWIDAEQVTEFIEKIYKFLAEKGEDEK